jgi:hypothetical protein
MSYYSGKYIEFSILKGKTLKSIVRQGDDALFFETIGGEKYVMYHENDCCETVTIDDICGDLEDLVGSPIFVAEKVMSSNENPKGVEAPEY